MSQKRDSLDNLISKENESSDLASDLNNQQKVEEGKQEAIKEIIVNLHKVTIIDHPMSFTKNIHRPAFSSDSNP
jgi:hypothetical protein